MGSLEIRLFLSIITLTGVILGSIISYQLSRRAQKRLAKTERRPELYLELLSYFSKTRPPYARDKVEDFIHQLLFIGRSDLINQVLKVVAIGSDFNSDSTKKADTHDWSDLSREKRKLVKMIRSQIQVDTGNWFRRRTRRDQDKAVEAAMDWLDKKRGFDSPVT